MNMVDCGSTKCALLGNRQARQRRSGETARALGRPYNLPTKYKISAGIGSPEILS